MLFQGASSVPQEATIWVKNVHSVTIYVQRFESRFLRFSKNSRSTKLIARHSVARYELVDLLFFNSWSKQSFSVLRLFVALRPASCISGALKRHIKRNGNALTYPTCTLIRIDIVSSFPLFQVHSNWTPARAARQQVFFMWTRMLLLRLLPCTSPYLLAHPSLNLNY